MAHATRVKVYRSSKSNPDIQFKEMLARFRKSCSDYGVMTLYKKYEFYESKGQKKRRKHKEALNFIRLSNKYGKSGE